MINTETKANVSNTSLRMYSFDDKQIINRFHDQMVDYLEKDDDVLSKGAFKTKISISRDFKELEIGGWDTNSIGIRPANVIKQGNRSVSEFATHILQLYVNYLQREKTRQSKMDFEQIYDLIAGHYTGLHIPIFSAEAYTDWIVNNLNKLHNHCVSIYYINELNANTYFLKRLIVKLNQTNSVDSAVISYIVEDLLQNYQYQIRRRNIQVKLPAELFALSGELQSFTANSTILHQKFTNLAEMDYSSLLELFKLTNITTVTLPLISILNIGQHEYLDKNINIDNVHFYVTNKEELEYFINSFIISKGNWTPIHLKEAIKNKIIFHFEDYKNILNNQIDTICNNFSHVETLTNASDVLSLLLKQSIYKK